MSTPHWKIVGQGLAGTCLAWHLYHRQILFTLIDREIGGSSRVAAGLINPITGKNFEPSYRIAEFLPQALEFYAQIEHELNCQIWYPLSILRLANSDKEWNKILSKTPQPDVTRWLANDGQAIAIDGWHGALELTGGGRLDTRAFLDQSRTFFQQRGRYLHATIDPLHPPAHSIWCEGSVGLMRGAYGPHRCAKGEILTLEAPTWNPSQIRIGAGGWLVPLGAGIYKVGSTYEWNQLDEIPTAAGRSRIETIAQNLVDASYKILAHDAGIRPILRRSEPLIGPIGNTQWMFNGLGSKGSLYAPGVASQLAAWLIDEIPPDNALNFSYF